jgi:zinc transport system substrate-binding protein
MRIILMKTRSRLAPVILLAASAALGGCGGDTSSTDSDRTVAAAFYPLAWATEEVAGDRYDVVNLTSPGGEPHDLELSIRQTALVGSAALVVHERGFQPAVDTAVEANAGGSVLDAAEVVDLMAHEDDHAGDDHAGEDHAEESEEGHDHEHGDVDPHFWQDPLRMADLGDAVAARLAELDPDHAGEYEERAADLRAELEALDREYADGLASCERDTVVVSHDAFGYLGKYGLHLEPVLGLTPDAEPTAATLADLRTLIEEEGVTTVFTETLASPRTAEALAAEAGVGTAVLDPVEGLTDDTADEDYVSLMRGNLEALQEANGC